MASGTGVVAVKYKDGVMVASDTLISYGSMARYPNIERVKVVGKQTVVVASGDYADFQYLCDNLDSERRKDDLQEDFSMLGPKEVHSWVSNVLYSRRSKFEPLMVSVLVAGYQDEQPFLGVVDSVGTTYASEDCAATGMASYMALPLLRSAVEKNPSMSREQAHDLLQHVMTVMFCRDSSAFNKVQFVDCTASGVTISAPEIIRPQWKLRGFDFHATSQSAITII
eukprot:RCo022222